MPNPYRQTRRKLAAAGKTRNHQLAEVIPAEISAPTTAPDAALAAAGATRVGVRLEKGWSRRNFLTEVLLPSLFARREGVPPSAAGPFPALAEGRSG